MREDTVEQYETVRLDVSSLRKLVEASEIWLVMDSDDSRTKARLMLGILDGLTAMVVGMSRKAGVSGAGTRAAVELLSRKTSALSSGSRSGKLKSAVMRRKGRCVCAVCNATRGCACNVLITICPVGWGRECWPG